MKRLRIKIIFTIIIIIVALFLFEFLATVINPHLNLPHANVGLMVGGRDVSEYPSGYIKDRVLFWRLDPSFEEYNSIGFRDREISKEKNVFRIICMGDSITFGWPNKTENTYPKVLEKLLNSQFSEMKFEVFNAGVPGYTSHQGLVWLQKEIIKYNPALSLYIMVLMIEVVVIGQIKSRECCRNGL